MNKLLVFLGYKSKKTLFVQVVSMAKSSIAIHRSQVSDPAKKPLALEIISTQIRPNPTSHSTSSSINKRQRQLIQVEF